jgi:histidinol-phosphate/aromatic aminotransferase/cobyric acid decarboxylase-like protein
MSHPGPGLRFHGDTVAAPGQLDFAVNVIPEIAVRPCHSFPGLTANHLRTAVRDPADNQCLIDALAETPDAGEPGCW